MGKGKRVGKFAQKEKVREVFSGFHVSDLAEYGSREKVFSHKQIEVSILCTRIQRKLT